jgi:hypothetical protein
VILPLPLDRERGVGVLDVDRFWIPVAGQPRGQVIDSIEQPRIAGFGREQNQLANGDNARVVLDSPSPNVANLVGKAITPAVHHTFARSPFDPFPTCATCRGVTQVAGWTTREIHEAVLTTFHLSADAYGLKQLRYDLRKLKGHGLVERDGTRYAYLLTRKGVQVTLLLLFFHKRLCGPLANSRFHHRPNPQHRPDSRLERAYHRADKAIEKIVDLLAAA